MDDFCAIGWHLCQHTTKISGNRTPCCPATTATAPAVSAIADVRPVPDLTPTIARWIRVLAGLAAAMSAGSAWVAVQVATASESGSPGAIAAAVVAGAAAVVCVGVAAAPRGRLRAWWRPCNGLLSRLTQPPAVVSPRAAALLLAVSGLSFAFLVGRLWSLPDDPWDDDQGAFLITAQEIHEQGGLAWLGGALWSGEFEEANRHPLYLGLLSLCPTVDGGRLLTISIGALTLVLLTASVLRRCGGLTGGIFSALLATNAAFCLFSTRVVCEVLLVLWCGLVWLNHLPRTSETTPDPVSPQRCAVGGALMGLAWLTKGTGLLLMLGYLLWIGVVSLPGLRAVSAERQPRGSRPDTRGGAVASTGLRLFCAAAAFLIVGSPLITRNVHRFGNPFHNLNSLLLFADRYEDLPDMVDRGLTTRTAAREYIESHSSGEIVQREATGLVWEAFILLRSLGPIPLDDARILFGVPLAVLALAQMAVRRAPCDGLLLIWGVSSWLVFAWYVPIAAGERFVLPLLAPALIAASEALGRGVAAGSRAAPRGTVKLAVVWCGVWVLATWLLLKTP